MGLVKYSLRLRPQLILPKVIYAHNVLVDIQHMHTFGMIVCVCVYTFLLQNHYSNFFI